MFYKNNFGKAASKTVKYLQQVKAPQKTQLQTRVKIHQKMEQERQLEKKLNAIQSTTSSTVYHKFYVSLQNVVDQTDPTVAWVSPNFPPIPNEKTRNLYVKKQSYLITNYYGTDYPRCFWITASGANGGAIVPGYLDNNGVITNRIAVMTLVSITSNVDDSGEKFCDLLYSQQDQVTWTIPSTSIQFSVVLDTGDILNMPLPNPININFEIRQIGI